MYKYIYILFFFCVSVLSMQHYFLPLTPRQLMAVIMFVVCVIEEKRLFWFEKNFFLYILFVLCYGLSSLITGYFPEYINRLFGDYFIAFVALWSVKILVIKYDSRDSFLYAFICFGVFDGIVTLFQFLGISYLDSFLNQFQLISYNPYLENYQGTGSAMLINCAPGVFSHPVLNGHALVVSTVISTVIAIKKNKYIGIILSIFMLVCLFSTQQRTAFATGLLSVEIILLISGMRSKYRNIVIPLFTILKGKTVSLNYQNII